MKSVYLLFHAHQLPEGEEDSKLIGVYGSRADASAAQARVQTMPGFKDHAGSFTIDAYEIGKNHWAEGFRTISAD